MEKKKELGKERMEAEEMERQRWRESVRETSAVQLSLFTLNPSRTHSHCHTHPPKGASDPGPVEEGECNSVTCITG